MDNVHGDYLLKRFYEERNSIMDLAARCTAQDRVLIGRHFDEIELQINRAFDDMEKERARRLGIEVTQ